MRTSEGAPPEPNSASEPSMLIAPSKRKWIVNECQKLEQSLLTDVAYLLDYQGDSDVDLVEAFCSPHSMLTKVARQAGLRTERWTIDDYDLATD